MIEEPKASANSGKRMLAVYCISASLRNCGELNFVDKCKKYLNITLQYTSLILALLVGSISKEFPPIFVDFATLGLSTIRRVLVVFEVYQARDLISFRQA